MSTRTVNIVVIAGVRPQFTKVAALQRAIPKFNSSSTTEIRAVYLNAGQHYDYELAEAQIRDLKIHFDYTLTHASRHPIEIFGSMISGTYCFLEGLRFPIHWAVLFGDAAATLSAGIACARRGIPIAHIEAGMRSGILTEPEEITRRMVDHVSTLHFCVTEDAVENLRKEGISDSVIFAGDLTYGFVTSLSEGLTGGFEGLPTNEYVIATFHKPDNVNSDYTLTNLVAALSDQPRPVLLVTHPRLRERMRELELTTPKRFTITPSLPYTKMISAMKGCAYLVTDSGGLHREAYYLGKRCLVRRDKGGWVRLMESGFHRYIGRDIKDICDGIEWIERQLRETHQPESTGLIRAGSYDNVLQILVRHAAP